MRMKRVGWGLSVALAIGLVGWWGVRKAGADAAGFFTNLPSGNAGHFIAKGFTSSGVQSAYAPGNVIFGYGIHATSASAECGLYDVTSMLNANLTAGNYIDEGGQASQYNNWTSSWPGPYVLVNGLGLIVVNGTCTVFSG